MQTKNHCRKFYRFFKNQTNQTHTTIIHKPKKLKSHQNSLDSNQPGCWIPCCHSAEQARVHRPQPICESGGWCIVHFKNIGRTWILVYLIDLNCSKLKKKNYCIKICFDRNNDKSNNIYYLCTLTYWRKIPRTDPGCLCWSYVAISSSCGFWDLNSS